jgi:hypothetical protein
MKVVVELPPMFAEIDKVFHVAGKQVIFAWNDTIFNPHGATVTPELQTHEEVHGRRQHGDPVRWWTLYLADPAFRLQEEIPAHQAEYAEFCRTHADRNHRARTLHMIAQRLASPLYGSMTGYAEAMGYMRKTVQTP